MHGQAGQNDDQRTDFTGLTQSPIGRRWLLKLGGAAGLATVLPPLPSGAPVGRPSARPALGGFERRDVYLALPDGTSLTDLRLRVAGRDQALTAMTAADRRHAAQTGDLLSLLAAGRLSHMARNVALPVRGPVELQVLGRRPNHGNRLGIVGQRVYIPRATSIKVAAAGIRVAGSAGTYARRIGLLRELGISSAGALNRLSPADFAVRDVLIDDLSTAVAFAAKHPEVMNYAEESAAQTNDILGGVAEVQTLADAITQLRQTDLPYWLEDILNADGSQAYVLQTDPDSPDFGKPIPDPDSGEPVPQQTLVLNPVLMGTFGDAVRASVNAVKNASELQGSTWDLTPSAAPVPQSASALRSAASSVDVKLSRDGWKWGTRVEIESFDPASRTLSLRLFNNYSRLLAVHAQYFSDEHTQLAVDNHDQTPGLNLSWRSTANSEYVTYVSDMPVLFGIPWALNANYSSFNITLPVSATFARILACGPAQNNDRSQWGPFFTNDVYSGKGYPTECQWPMILTYIFDLGVPFILLQANAAVASGEDVKALQDALGYAALGSSTLVKNALDAFQKILPYLANDNSQGVDNTPVLLKMAELLPQVLWGVEGNFEIFWRAAVTVTALIIKYLLVKAIPMLGQVFSAMAAAGNLIQIATTSAELALSPWVIDTDIRFTYAASIRLSKDPGNATWPRAAGGARWTLSQLLNGVSTTNPITGSITDGQSADIVVTLPQVPVTGTVQYTLRITDADQNLIGRGSSAILANDDFQHLPTSVAITIQELLKPITPQTSFVRQTTLVYDSSNKGYTWGGFKSLSTTVANKPAELLELDSTAVGTVSGMLGTIWRSNDANKSYRVRNAPTVQNGSTINVQFSGAYTRRPFIVYDRVNPDLTNGDNFFLQPVGDVGYLVRRLQLSAAGGTLGWTPNQAWGQFPQNLSAVTRHPSGALIGVNAVTGKLMKLVIPRAPVADNDFPYVAEAHAGPGTRPGLTQAPVGIAATLEGIIVVLEAGASRLQAFDVDGNPVAYFGSGDKSYFAPLAGRISDTRLSLAVDGVGWFYVLSYTGSGATPADYHLDVYKPDGSFVVSSPGVNAATLDVDYWRTIFSLDYAALQVAGGDAYIDPVLGRIQPSSSIWVPRNPA